MDGEKQASVLFAMIIHTVACVRAMVHSSPMWKVSREWLRLILVEAATAAASGRSAQAVSAATTG
jgi:hypothetical protein